ncbi:MAG: Cadmium, cobalt and zinc/H(+)-K(+) antiporter [Gammaproteobacteria bacterium]|nr:Cadmium, cobalt and zinc/H(+)-K(+) antiporter [Gammaproteobacteria bacterium]
MKADRQCYYRFDAETLHASAERSTIRVIALTAVMMLAEIVGGIVFGSMALLADGWHMATHVAALGITALAYRYARIHADNPAYTFGTGKIGVLGGFASGVALMVVAAFMAVESAARLFKPGRIEFNEAIAIALLGLLVNLLSAWWLHDHGGSDSHPDGAPQQRGTHDPHRHGHDHNLRAAYLHVLADALTSVLALVALGCGKLLGWIWMDSLMGIVGGLVIARWCHGLLRDSAGVLLDRRADEATERAMRDAVERDGTHRIADLHIWHIAPNQMAAIVEVESTSPQPPDYYRRLLEGVVRLVHVTVQVSQAPGGRVVQVSRE